MKVSLQQLPAIEAGDSSVFALRIEFVSNLDPGFAAPEDDISWGRFAIWVRGKNLCEHLDRGEVRRSVEWYLLPLLEWFVEQWDPLFHEQRLPGRNGAQVAWESLARTNRPEFFNKAGGWDAKSEQEQASWVQRHALRACREGGLFPDVIIRRMRHSIELSWGETPLAGAPEGFRFLHGKGSELVSPFEMTSVVHDVVRRAVSALREEMPESARIRELEVRIRALKDKDRQKARTAILAGLGGHLADWQERWAELNRRLSERLRVAESALKGWFFPADTDDLCVAGHCEAAVMFGSASPNLTESDVLEIATRVFQSTESGSSEKWHASVVDPEPWTGGKEVWRDGYRLAKEWTDHSGIEVNSSGGVDVDQHLRDLGVHVEDISLDDRGIAGIAVMPATGVPRVFLNPRNIQCSYPTGRRFVLAHELCHLLHDRERGADLAMISGPWAPLELEKRANAFAAALLIQDSTLGQTEVARNGRATLVELVSLARRLQVSPNALAHHLGNLGYIDHSNRDELLSELAASLMDREQSTKNPR